MLHRPLEDFAVSREVKSRGGTWPDVLKDPLARCEWRSAVQTDENLVGRTCCDQAQGGRPRTGRGHLLCSLPGPQHLEQGLGPSSCIFT